MTPGELEAAIELLGRLVAARSPNPPGDERAVADVIQGEAARLGLPEGRLYAAHPARPNLIFQVGKGFPNLLLAGHMDTMPPGDEKGWSADPYKLQRIDGRLIGLGSADMKAGIASMLLVAARLLRDPVPRGSITLVFAADEESCSAFGMEWLAGQGLLHADAAIVLEPSSHTAQSWERLFLAQRGSSVCWLTARGEPGHSGALVARERRASAAFARALSALLEADPFPQWKHVVDGTPATINVATMVEGGFVPFAHAASLRATIEVRTLEGMTPQLVLDKLREIIARAGLDDRVSIEPAAPPHNWFSPGTTMHDERLLEAARGAWRKVLGREPVPGVFLAGTDSSWLNAAGIAAIPAFGPGSLAVAHQPNESVRVDDLSQAVELLETTVRSYHNGSTA